MEKQREAHLPETAEKSNYAVGDAILQVRKNGPIMVVWSIVPNTSTAECRGSRHGDSPEIPCLKLGQSDRHTVCTVPYQIYHVTYFKPYTVLANPTQIMSKCVGVLTLRAAEVLPRPWKDAPSPSHS